MEEKVKGGLGKASFVLGIIAVIFALLPVLSPWFMVISWLVYVIAFVGVILGVIAILKKQQKAILGTALCVAAVVAFILIGNSDWMAERTLESAASALDGVKSLSESAQGFGAY